MGRPARPAHTRLAGCLTLRVDRPIGRLCRFARSICVVGSPFILGRGCIPRSFGQKGRTRLWSRCKVSPDPAAISADGMFGAVCATAGFRRLSSPSAASRAIPTSHGWLPASWPHCWDRAEETTSRFHPMRRGDRHLLPPPRQAAGNGAGISRGKAMRRAARTVRPSAPRRLRSPRRRPN